MKLIKNLLSFCLLALLPALSRAQAPEQECPNAISVCQPLYTQTNSYVGYGATQELNTTNAGCLLSNEKNDVWYIMNVTSSGTLAFTISPNQSTDDYDFAVWNATGTGCQGVYNNLPAGCNYSGVTGATGLSNTITGPQWSPALNVLAGETYILNVSNFSSTQYGYTLDFGPSTASIYDTVKPKFLNAGTKCQFVNDTLTVTYSEPVKCSSIAPNGSDFYITPAGSTTIAAFGTSCLNANSASTVVKIKFANVPPPGTYYLHVQQGSDGNTIFDNCGNQQSTSDSIQFTMNPAAPPAIVKLDTPACIKGIVVIDRRIRCSSVAPNGSDFVVTGPSPVSVVSATPLNCNSYGLADSIAITFDKSIVVPGTYNLSVTNGTDGNPINDTCSLAIGNVFSWVVSDKGYVEAIASPNLLCEKGYVQLDAISSIVLPQVTSCGPAASVPAGNLVTAQLGTGAPATGALYPFTSYWHDGRTQLLFTGAELAAQGLKKGTITSISLNVSAKNSTAPFNGFTIKMGCTSLTALPTNFAPAPATIVYTPKPYTTVPGVNTFVLDVPYNWDSVSNLIIELCYDNSGYTQYDYVDYTVTSFNSAVYYYADNSVGCNFTTSNAPLANRPNVTFKQVVPPPQIKKWYPGTFVGDTTAFSTTAYVPATSTYTFETMDSNFCYRRDTANVIVSVRNPKILLPTKDTAICVGDTLQLLAAGGVTYQWSPVDYLSCTNCENPVSKPTTTVTYTVTIGDQYGCTDDLKRQIVVHPLPVVNVGADTTVIYGTSLQLNVSAPGGMYYLWDPITYLNNANIPDPIVTPEVTTLYTVRVVDTNRCENWDTIKVKVKTDIPVTVPTAFSPNGDGLNDVFRPGNIIFQKLVEFRVFNRWGREIFSSTDPKKGWDGTFNGEPQEIGVYNYLIRVAWPGGRVETYKGDVTLVR